MVSVEHPWNTLNAFWCIACRYIVHNMRLFYLSSQFLKYQCPIYIWHWAFLVRVIKQQLYTVLCNGCGTYRSAVLLFVLYKFPFVLAAGTLAGFHHNRKDCTRMKHQVAVIGDLQKQLLKNVSTSSFTYPHPCSAPPTPISDISFFPLLLLYVLWLWPLVLVIYGIRLSIKTRFWNCKPSSVRCLI